MTLTEFSYYLRRYIPYAFLFLLVVAILVASVQLLLLIRARQVAQEPTYKTIFNQIKNPLTHINKTTEGITFSIDTIEGRPVGGDDGANVYYLLPPPATKFGYLEKAHLIARGFGFDTDTAVFRLFNDQAIFTEANQTITIDVKDFNFSYEFAFENDPSVFESTVTPTTLEAESKAKSFLQNIDVYPKELTQGQTNAIFFRFDSEQKKVTTIDSKAPSGAVPDEAPNMIEIDFSRPDLEGLPVVGSSYFNTGNYMLMAFYNTGEHKILKSQIEYYERSDDQVGFYPLRSADEAYADLQSGNGYVINNPLDEKTITIKEMFLAYYDHYDQDAGDVYLQPVYVFIGKENNFVAYVPAVSKLWLSQ